MPDRIRFPETIEPLVRMIEETPPDAIVDRTLAALRDGTDVDTMLVASALAVTLAFGVAPASLVLVPLLALGTIPVRAAESATVQEILDGDQLYIDQKQARVKARADAPQVVSTKDSRGQLAFSGGAAGRLNRFSILRLGTSCFLMEKGQILVSGKQNGCTRSARLSVRGTNYVVDVQEDGSSEISVLEGAVEVEPGGVWIHGASLGEGRIASALIAAIRERTTLPILRTCSSGTACQPAARAFAAVAGVDVSQGVVVVVMAKKRGDAGRSAPQVADVSGRRRCFWIRCWVATLNREAVNLRDGSGNSSRQRLADARPNGRRCKRRSGAPWRRCG